MFRFLRNLLPAPPASVGTPGAGPVVKSSDLSKRPHRLRRPFRASAGSLLGLALLALAGAGGAATAKAATISTLFKANNSSGGAVYFNLTVGPRDIAITGLRTNAIISLLTGEGQSKDEQLPAGIRSFSGFRVDIRDGAALGKETDLSGWTMASEGTVTVPGTGKGENQRSPVALKSKIVLKAGRTYGFRLIAPPNILHAYSAKFSLDDDEAPTESSEPLQLRYANADLELNFGSFKDAPFDASKTPFSPAVWNGEIQYTVSPMVSAVPLPAAAWLFLSALGALGGQRVWAGWRRRRPAA